MQIGENRGCQDGPFEQARFWFPTWDNRLIPHAYGMVVRDSHPLITGPNGAVFVYSGGVLISLSADSVKKVTSMREELWMTDNDEGTPQYPCIGDVIGVHDNYVYRCLVRTDYREEVILRRLRCEDFLRRPRSELRARAPSIWPSLMQNRELERPDLEDRNAAWH
ncbi:unnamed protein product [Effrenium voratum]|nr:unnamed protein product [Effrenium voratum]